MRYVFLLLLFFGVIACDHKPGKKQETKINSPLNYHLSGKGTRTIVFIHGWCINQTYWNSQVSLLEKDYRVLTLDLAGHGQSKVERKDWTIRSYANDIVDILRQLDSDSVILVAHSMAGNIALHIYDSIPKKIIGIIGIDNLRELGVEHSEEELKQLNAYFDKMKSDFPNQVKEHALKYLFSATTADSIKQRVVSDFQNSDPGIAIPTIQSLILEGKYEKQMAPTLRFPLLLVLSDNGTTALVDSTSLNKYCGKGYQIFTVKGTGHYPMIEAPGEFNTQLNQALHMIPGF